MSDDGNFCCRPTTIFKRTRSVYISSPVGYFILIFFLLKVKAWWTTNTETGPVARTGAQFETKCVEICFDGTLLPKQYDLIIYFSFRGAIWLSLPLQTNLSCGIQSRETEDYFYLLQIIVQLFFFALFSCCCVGSNVNIKRWTLETDKDIAAAALAAAYKAAAAIDPSWPGLCHFGIDRALESRTCFLQ